MSYTSKILKSVGAAATMLAISQAAVAGPTTAVNVYDGNGGVLASNVKAFDWNEAGSGLAVKVGLPSTLVEGQTFDFQYQSNLVAYTGGTNTGGLNSAYEITVVATISEIVSAVTHKADGNTAVEFKALGGTLQMFYSTTVNADIAAGTGFNDGTLIGTFNVNAGGNSTLTTYFGDNEAGGFTSYSLESILSSINSSYLTAATGITGMNFTSSQYLPAGTSQTDQVNGVASTDGILLKVDGSSTFSTVPEPGMLALLSMGLVGLGFGARRRKS